MSASSEEPEEWAAGPEKVDVDPPPLVVIVDTSLLIEIKLRIPAADGDQFDLLMRMLQLVEEGLLAFPRKVHRELTNIKWTDAPGAWCGRAVRVLQYKDPQDESVAAVLAHAPKLIEEDADDKAEKADPYVAAMAYELAHGDPPNDVVVATTDNKDHLPVKIALKTACEALGLTCWDFDAFVAWVLASTGEPQDGQLDDLDDDPEGLGWPAEGEDSELEIHM